MSEELNASLTIIAQCDGEGFNYTLNETGKGVEKHVPTLSAGLAATLTTNGGNYQGTLTFVEDPGITSGTIGIFWEGGKTTKLPVTGHGGNAENGFTVDFGTTGENDHVPAQDTEVIVSVPLVVSNISFDGDNIPFLELSASGRSMFVFCDSGGVTLWGKEITDATHPYAWAESSGDQRPITGNPVASLKCYNGTINEVTSLVKALLAD